MIISKDLSCHKQSSSGWSAIWNMAIQGQKGQIIVKLIKFVIRNNISLKHRKLEVLQTRKLAR